MAKREVDIKVKYIPDTSALKSALSGAQKIDFKIGGSGLKKELLAPVQNAMKEVNKAIASGADNKTLLKLFQNIGKEADLAKNKAQGMLNELNTVFSSSGNQKLLTDLKTYEKELEKSQKKLAAWDKKYSTKTGVESDYSKLRDTVTKESNGNIKTLTEARAEIKKLTEDTKELSQVELERLNNLQQFAKLGTERQNNPRKALELDVNKYQGLVNDTKLQVQTPNVNIEGTKTYTAIIRALGEAAGLTSKEINNLISSIRKEDEAAAQAANAQKKLENQSKKTVTKFGDVLTGTFLGTSLNSLMQTALNRGITFFKEYDEILTRTMMVTGKAREEVNGLTDSYNKLATQLTSTTKDVAAAQLVFYQQGLSTNESLAMTEASIAISKTGGIEASEAANRLTAAVRGYKLAATDAMNIADKMSALDAAAASSVDELTVAMQKSASQARMAGLDLDYYMAYLSTMQEVTREAPENIGTAMKSITSRLQEISDIGKVEEDGTTFSNVAKALNSVGIAAVDSQGQLRSLQEVLNELGPMWADLDRNHKAYLATVLAGNRQQSRFIALMDNYDRALELVNVSQNSSGNTAKQLRAYNQGLEASFIKLTDAWQQFATRIATTDTIKVLVDALTSLLETINSLPKGFTKAVAGAYALSKSFNFIQSLKTVNFKGWFGDVTGLSKHIKAMDDVGNSAKTTRDKIKALGDQFKNYLGITEQGNATLTQSATSQGVLTTSINTTNAARSAEIALKEGDNGTDLEEINENNNIRNSQEALGEAIEGTTKALKAQNNVYNQNGPSKLTQMQADQRKTKLELAELKERRAAFVTQNKEATANLNAGRAAARAGYEAAIDPKNLRREAEALLRDEGLLTGPIQETLFPDFFNNTKQDKMIQARMKELKKQYGIWYNERLEELEDIANRTREPNNEIVEELDEQIEAVEEKLKQGAANITKLEKKNAQARKKEEAKNKKKETVPKTNNDNKNNEINPNKIGLNDFIQPYVIKTVTEMGASMLGLSDTVGKVISGFTSMGSVGVSVAKKLQAQFKKSGKQLSTFKMLAIEAGFALAGMVLSWIDSLNSIDTINERLEKTMSERDSVVSKTQELKDNLKTYKEINAKVLKTEEEQNNLTASANALASILPDIVQGYDSAGNAIIDIVRAQQELNELSKEEEKLTDKAIGLYNDKIKVQGKASVAKNTATAMAVTAPVAMKIGTLLAPETAGLSLAIAAAVEGGVAAITAAGTAIHNWVTGAKDFKDALVEAKDEVIGLLQATTKVPEGMEGLKNTIINAVYNQGYEEEFGPEEMQRRIKEITDVLNSNSFSSAINKLKIDIQDPHLDTVKFKEKIIEELKKMGFKDEQITLIYDGVASILWGGEINVSAIDDQLQKYIDGNYSDAIKQGATEISKLEARLKKELYESGLLTEDMLENVFSGMSAQEITNAFYKSNVYDATNGLANILDETYRDVNAKYEKIKQLTGENSTIGANLKFAEEERDKALERWKSLGDEISGFEDPNDINERDFDLSYQQGNVSEAVYATYKDWKYWNDTINDNNNKLKQNKEAVNQLKNDLGPLEATLDSVADSFVKATEMPSFETMRTTINDAIAPLKSFNDTLKGIYEMNGAVTFDSLDNLLNSLQQIQTLTEKAGISTEYWNAACGALADGLSVQDGVIHMNIDSTELMTKVAVAGYQAQMQQMINQIDARIAQAETEKQIIEKEIAFMKDKVLSAKSGAEAESMIENDLAGYMTDIHVQEVENTNKQYAAQLRSASIYANKMAAIMQKMYNGETVKDSDFADAFEGLTKGLSAEIKNGVGELTDNPKWKDSVNSYIERLEKQRDNLQQTIDGEYKLKDKLSALLNSGNLDLGKMLGNGMEKANDEIDEYIGKLERTFNLIQRIDRLTHQISDNANLKDLYKNYDGEKYADSLLTELGLMKERYEYQKQLFKMQQEEAGKQRGKIEDSPYAGLFTFDKNDLIQIDWEAYHALSGKDQEEIDILVDKYEELQDAVESTEIEMAEFAKATQEAWLEIENTIIDAENTIVNALKNREKIMHEARQKALDDEIEMIEKAVEARNKANERENQNKDLYQAQEALRRATLDSSGKNNAQLLQLQQDLEDKQLEISEKRFEEDMEDRKQWLQDTKDAETETYEYRLETMTWYWEEAQEIMNSGTENIMQFLIAWDEQYQVQSETARNQTKRGWEVMYEQIQELYDNGFDLTTFHAQMQDVVNDLAAQEINIQSIATAWEAATRAANEYRASIPNTSGLNTTYTGGNDNNNNNKDNGEVGKGLTSNAPFSKGQQVEIHTNGILPGASPNYYDENGNKKGESMFRKSGAVTDVFYSDKLGSWMVKFGNLKYYYKAEDVFLKNNKTLLQAHMDAQKPGYVFAKGGMVDYTGPAWVDGTQSHPEAFLSAYQTEQIGALAGALDSNTVNNVSGDSNISFGSINFNVASMSSAADGKKALDIFVQGANDLMAKKGVNTKINLNIK